jgi:hypothetical protein
VTIEQAARLLFVSPAHVRLLLDRGELRTAHGENAEDVDIDVASIDTYRERLDEARRRYFASQNEGDEPLGNGTLLRLEGVESHLRNLARMLAVVFVEQL